MPRRPKQGYKQETGRPHDALHNHAKYDLTYEEAVALVNSGKWRSFYTVWKRKELKKSRIKLLNYTCPECGERKENENDWKPSGKVCIECHKAGNKTLRCRGCNDRPGIGMSSVFRGQLLCERCMRVLMQLIETNRETGRDNGSSK